MLRTYTRRDILNNIKKLDELKYCVIINALCFTKTIKSAANEVGISRKSMYAFVKDNNITINDLCNMRNDFKKLGIKVNKRL